MHGTQCSKILEALVAARANVNIVAKWKLTALHLAVQHGCPATVQFLLSARAKPNASSSPECFNGAAALHLAAFSVHSAEVTEALLSAHADLAQGDSAGQVAVHYAARYDRTEMLQILLRARADVDSRDREHRTPLFDAGRSAAEALLRAGATLDARASNHETAIMQQTQRGHPETVALLIGARAQLDSRSQNGSSLMHFAVASYSADTFKMVKLLLDARANADERDGSGMTPLHRSLRLAEESYSLAHFVKVLAPAGANVNTVNADGETLLFTAARKRGSSELVRALLAARADPRHRAPSGERAESVTDSRDLAEVLRDARLQLGGPLTIVVNGLGGPRCTLKASSDWSTRDVQEAIFLQIGVPRKRQTLLRGTQKVPDKRLLADQENAASSETLTLTLVVKPEEEEEHEDAEEEEREDDEEEDDEDDESDSEDEVELEDGEEEEEVVEEEVQIKDKEDAGAGEDKVEEQEKDAEEKVDGEALIKDDGEEKSVEEKGEALEETSASSQAGEPAAKKRRQGS